MDTKFTTKVTAGLSVAALALMGFAGTTSAYAQEGDGSSEDSSVSDQTNNLGDQTISSSLPAVSSITNDKGSITVTKLTPSSETQQPGNGTKLSKNPEDSKGIKNVKFTAAKVDGIDLKTNEGWKKAAAVMEKNSIDNKDKPTTVTGDKNYTLSKTDRKEGRTNGDGILELNELPVGLYLVWETVDQNVDIDGGETGVAPSRINKAAPFFVSIPMTNSTRTGWMYDIFAYPKNDLKGKPTKTVDDDKAGVGSGNAAEKSTITYTLSADIPNIPEIKRFELVDKFKTSQLEWIGADTDTVEIYEGDTKVAKLTKGTDFQFSEVKKSDDNEYSFIAVEILNPNTTLAAHKEGKKLKWKMHAKVKDTTGPTEVPNTPYLNEGPEGWTTTEPGEPGPEVKSYYGKVTINKKGTDNTPLDGAKFVLYECSETGFTDPINEKEIPGNWALEEDNRVTVDTDNEWVSADGGVITIDGLLVNDFRNNSRFINGKDGDTWASKSWYCLKEIQAPNGYELLPNPIKFQITSTNGTADPVNMVMDVHNQKTPELPVTGGAGIAVLVSAGVLLLAGSGVYAFAYNRKRKLSH